jgi:hypothetical protein
MCTEKELKSKLDTLPEGTPPEIGPDLFRMHREFHAADQINESIPRSYISVPGMDDTGRLLSDLVHLSPTHLQTALEILDELLFQVEEHLFSNWSSPTLQLANQIYKDHYPPASINHQK